MTGDERAPLLLLAPGVEKKTKLLLAMGKRLARETTGTSCWCREETGRTTGFLLRLVPALVEGLRVSDGCRG